MPHPRQRTLVSAAGMEGRGLHTGKECSITLLPADAGTGIVFCTEHGEVRASVENVKDTRRGTTLACGEAIVHTVEHLLSALAGLAVDNIRVEIAGPEIPAADGSALPFVELVERAEIREMDAPARLACLSRPIWTVLQDKYMLADSHDILRARALIAFPHPMIGEQAASFKIDPETFKREIAPARTFCTSGEIEAILSQGLGLGGSIDNVVVAHEDHYSVPLRFENEFARHKLLDLIGDLSLIGARLCADVTAIKSSHTTNVALAAEIANRAAITQGG
ncbi:MAG: UDP-3-O-acyl-N-acetylglucosamine deacetylase [Armatimonadota bacterium]